MSRLKQLHRGRAKYSLAMLLIAALMCLSACEPAPDTGTTDGGTDSSSGGTTSGGATGGDSGTGDITGLTKPDGPSPPGMVWVPGGEFAMGGDDDKARPDEQPLHQVKVSGFWMDATEITNAQFRKFVEATKYVTVSEKGLDRQAYTSRLREGQPPPKDAELVPGSLVFRPPPTITVQQHNRWWQFDPAANWQMPLGKGTDIKGKDDHPVLHISWVDAMAYCKWAGKSLPTEAQWERAARGGKDNMPYTWGKEKYPKGKHMANIWQGNFPQENLKVDGHVHSAPVKSYPPNDFGLYDMAGNVWEWTSDFYHHEFYQVQKAAGVSVNPLGPATGFDPRYVRNPRLRPDAPQYVMRGGSFLSADSYSTDYKPSRRMKAAPQETLMDLGFRCVMSSKMWQEIQGKSSQK
jgi:sulfatase modifying factor 1